MNLTSFIESAYFAWYGGAYLGQDPEFGKWTEADLAFEIDLCNRCQTEEAYLKVSRAGARIRMDRFGKRAVWSVLKKGVRW